MGGDYPAWQRDGRELTTDFARAGIAPVPEALFAVCPDSGLQTLPLRNAPCKWAGQPKNGAGPIARSRALCRLAGPAYRPESAEAGLVAVPARSALKIFTSTRRFLARAARLFASSTGRSLPRPIV